MREPASRRRLPVSAIWSRLGAVGRLGWGLGHTFLEGLVELLAPWRCPLCGGDAPDGGTRGPSLCGRCTAAFAADLGHCCGRCGARLPPNRAAGCWYCRQRGYRFESTLVLAWYRGLARQAVLRMKYAAHEPLTLAVGRLLSQRVAQAPWLGQLDLIAPVPLGWWKRWRRGASSPELLAEQLGRGTGLPVLPRLLRCRRTTRKQGTLLPAERRRNVRGAFEASASYDITNSRILLVDDVMTTGATADEATRELLRAGATCVRVVAVARGSGHVELRPPPSRGRTSASGRPTPDP